MSHVYHKVQGGRLPDTRPHWPMDTTIVTQEGGRERTVCRCSSMDAGKIMRALEFYDVYYDVIKNGKEQQS